MNLNPFSTPCFSVNRFFIKKLYLCTTMSAVRWSSYFVKKMLRHLSQEIVKNYFFNLGAALFMPINIILQKFTKKLCYFFYLYLLYVFGSFLNSEPYFMNCFISYSCSTSFIDGNETYIFLPGRRKKL